MNSRFRETVISTGVTVAAGLTAFIAVPPSLTVVGRSLVAVAVAFVFGVFWAFNGHREVGARHEAEEETTPAVRVAVRDNTRRPGAEGDDGVLL